MKQEEGKLIGWIIEREKDEGGSHVGKRRKRRRVRKHWDKEKKNVDEANNVGKRKMKKEKKVK